MRGKIFLILLLLFFGFNCSVVLALDPMGPPSAGLKQGQFSAGAEYSYSRMDITLNHGKGGWQRFQDGVLLGQASGKLSSYNIKHLKLNKVFANFGYGVTDNWEVFLRLGSADVDFKYKDQVDTRFSLSPGSSSLFPVEQSLNGDNGFAIGFGTKVTFYKKDKLKLGGLFQLSWFKSKAEESGVYNGAGLYPHMGSATHVVSFCRCRDY